jgi:hypothetical protein
MKTTEHVEYLLRQGKKPKELVELGFPKRVVTRVRRQLREERTVPRSRTRKAGTEVKSLAKATSVQSGTGSLENEVQELDSRVQVLEAVVAELYDIGDRLDGTPALGLRHRFKCECGASGLVALHVRCTKCGRESYWGWWPEKE